MTLEKAIAIAKTLVEDGGFISQQELEAVEVLINIAEQSQKDIQILFECFADWHCYVPYLFAEKYGLNYDILKAIKIAQRYGVNHDRRHRQTLPVHTPCKSNCG
jgi:hypothetical protein